MAARSDGSLLLWNLRTGALEDIWPNVSGLWIQGVDLRRVKWARPLTPREKRWLTLCGAILD